MTKHIKFVIIFAMLLQSCTSTVIEEPDVEDLPDIVETIKYNPDVQAVINSNCLTCHSGPAPNAGLDLSTYTNVRAGVELGNVVARINNALNPMPPSGLMPAESRQIIDKWIEDGYQED